MEAAGQSGEEQSGPLPGSVRPRPGGYGMERAPGLKSATGNRATKTEGLGGVRYRKAPRAQEQPRSAGLAERSASRNRCQRENPARSRPRGCSAGSGRGGGQSRAWGFGHASMSDAVLSDRPSAPSATRQRVRNVGGKIQPLLQSHQRPPLISWANVIE